MKVDIRDADVLRAIQPSAFATYLRTRGWKEHAEAGASWTAFTYGDFEITLPLTTDLRDFSIRMSEALRTLELAEDRSQLQLLSDLSAARSISEQTGFHDAAVLPNPVVKLNTGSRAKAPRRKTPRFEIPKTSKTRNCPEEFEAVLRNSGFPLDCIEVVSSEVTKVIDRCREPMAPFLTIKEQRHEFIAVADLAHQLLDRWHGISLEYRHDLPTNLSEQLSDFISLAEDKVRRLTFKSAEESVEADLVQAYGPDGDVPIEEVVRRMADVEHSPREHGLRGEQPDVQRRRLFLHGLSTIWFRFHPEPEHRPIAWRGSEDTYLCAEFEYASSGHKHVAMLLI
jgi:hypothetical protein